MKKILYFKYKKKIIILISNYIDKDDISSIFISYQKYLLNFLFQDWFMKIYEDLFLPSK